MTKSIKNDNRGLTLIELIIGVVILAIVITPLLHTLITGANTTMKSKRYNDATIAAQNLAEKIAATDMNTYLKDFDCVKVRGQNHYSKTITDKIESGGTQFDARISMVAEKSAVPISNAMDAVFQMQAIDGNAYGMFLASADELKTSLKRYITIDVSPSSENASSECTVTVTFSYSGTGRDYYLDGEGNRQSNDVPFSWKSVSSMNVQAGDDFSVFLFFCAYYNPLSAGSSYPHTNPYNIDMGRTTINNNTEYSFNLFLLETTGNTSIIKQDVDGRYTNRSTSVDLMTNMDNITFKTYLQQNSVWQTPHEVEVHLVESTTVDRLFDITIDILKKGTEEVLFTMNTKKLDYSNANAK